MHRLRQIGTCAAPKTARSDWLAASATPSSGSTRRSLLRDPSAGIEQRPLRDFRHLTGVFKVVTFDRSALAAERHASVPPSGTPAFFFRSLNQIDRTCNK
jgi:hypothetical protein